MGLIKCPECNGNISDTVEQCIHCGYSIGKEKSNTESFKIKLNGTEIDSDEIFEYIENDNILNTVKFIMNKTGCSKEEALETVRELKDFSKSVKISNTQTVSSTKKHNYTYIDSTNRTPTPQNTPKCPKCNSTNIQLVNRKWSVLTGFMTNKVDRVCVNCKHKW